ncbi:MAG TPA: hypothetical protein VH442_06655, partial [Micromonosporaceae bacterium]
MTRDEADRLLASIGAAYDRIATTMYAVDNHQALQYLRTETQTGVTKQMREAMLFDVDVMWAQFNAIGDVLEQARTLRAQHRPSDSEWANLARLLAGPIVALDSAGMPVVVPVPSRSGTPTLGAPVTTSTTGRIVGAVRVGDVAVGLQARCIAAIGRLDATGRSWNAATTAVATVTSAMSTLTSLARDVGDEAGVRPLEARTSSLREMVLGDPLAYAPNGVATSDIRQTATDLASDIAIATARVRSESGLRDAYPERIAMLLGDIEALEIEESETAAAFAHAAEKIASTGLPAVPNAASVLRNRIGELDALRAQQRWRRLADDVATVRDTIARAIARARELRAAADGLVARRDELRGRLEGY